MANKEMDFYKRLNLVCNRIPYGRAATYGQLALLCGKPRNSRQVGYALNRGLAGDIPAYRVVNSQGILSGAMAFDTPDMQKLLLEAEGIVVLRIQMPENPVYAVSNHISYKVDLKKYGWKHTMEDALHLKKKFEEKGI